MRLLILALTVLALVLGGGAAISQDDGAPDAPTPGSDAADPVGEAPAGYNVYADWLDSNHEAGQRPTECLMCAGFGGGFECGASCDSTGLTIFKPEGTEHHICGVCVEGAWVKE